MRKSEILLQALYTQNFEVLNVFFETFFFELMSIGAIKEILDDKNFRMRLILVNSPTLNIILGCQRFMLWKIKVFWNLSIGAIDK